MNFFFFASQILRLLLKDNFFPEMFAISNAQSIIIL